MHGPTFMTPFLARPSEDKANRRCVRQNTNLKLRDVLCVCIFRQRPSFRAENYAFEKVRNRMFNVDENNLTIKRKFGFSNREISENLIYAMEYPNIFMLLPR
jgi:hypothetical protein